MDKNPHVGIRGPRMISPEGEIQFSARSFPSYLTSISSGQSILNRVFPKNPWSGKYLLKNLDRNQTHPVDWVSGSGLLTKREVLEKIGLLDERFFMYAEDVDFCYRAKKAGYLVYYFPDCLVVHHIGISTQRSKTRMLTEHHRSMFLFYRKHYPSNIMLTAMVFLGIWIRLWFSLGTGFIHTK
jgi:GT2 family glycosyltransferase